MRRALLLDLGNVLVRFDHGITLERLSRATGRPLESLRRALYAGLEDRYGRGALSTQEFFREAERLAGLPRLPDDVWVPAWRDIFEPIPEALACLTSLAEGVRTAIVSNTNALHWEGVLRVAPVDRMVDALALSFEVGAAKPEPGIFEAALARLDARPEDGVFADDRPDYVEAARTLGLDAFVVEGPGALPRELGRRGMLDHFRRGLAEFESGHPFEAHEEWETLWMRSQGDEKLFLQALIQIAAGCVHLGRGRKEPAGRLFGLALDKLQRFDGVRRGLDLGALRGRIEAARANLAATDAPDLLRELRLR